jgi:hypothetical protein
VVVRRRPHHHKVRLVEEVARPTGIKPERTHPGFRVIPIEGVDQWDMAYLTHA